MGVVYKLKDEVVEFILRQKQENPNISCRKLVDIIQETFQISVSKSSINIIIKEANLSNPVGRTPAGSKSTFKIPQDKKTELFFKTKSTLEDVLGASLPTSPPPATVEPPSVLPAKEALEIKAEEPFSPAPDTIQELPLIEPMKASEPNEMAPSEGTPVDKEVRPSLLSDPVNENTEVPLEASEGVEPPSQELAVEPVRETETVIEPPSADEIREESPVEDEPKPSLLSDPLSNIPTEEKIEVPPEPPAEMIEQSLQPSVTEDAQEIPPVVDPPTEEVKTEAAELPAPEAVVEESPQSEPQPNAVENSEPPAEMQTSLPSDPFAVTEDPQPLKKDAAEETFSSPGTPEHIAAEELKESFPDDEHADEPRISLLPDPVSRPPEATSEEKIASIVPSSPESAGELFENAALSHLLLRGALWDLSKRPFLEKFFKNHTDLTDEDIQILDALMCLWDPVFDEPAKAIEADRAWIWRLNGFESVPTLERLENLLRRVEGVTVDEFDFYLEAGYFFSFAGEARICLRDRSAVKLDPRLSMFAGTPDTFCPTDSSVDKITQFITDPDNRLVIRCPSLSGSVADIKNLAAACENSVQKEIQKIILYDAAGKPMVEFSEIPVFPRGLIFVSQATSTQIKETLNVSVAFEASQFFLDRAGQPVYWMESLSECKLSEVPGDQIVLKIVVFSKTVQGDQEITIIIADKKTQPQEGYRSTINTELIDLKEFVDKSSQESAFLASSQKNILGKCLRVVKGQIEKYAQALFKGLKDPSCFNTSTMLTNIYIKFDEKSIEVVLPQNGEKMPDCIPNLEKVLNYCDLTDYAKRRFCLYIKI